MIMEKENQKLYSITKLLENSWEIYKKNFKILCGIMSVPFFFILAFALMSIPLGFFSLFIKTLSTGSYVWLSLLKTSALFILIFFTCLLLTGAWSQIALLYAIKERKNKASIKESFLKTKDKIISSILISFAVGFCVAFGFIFLFIPGIVFLVWFYFSHYVLVAEDLSGTKALKRSRELTKGKEIDIFVRLIVIFIIVFLISALFNAFTEKLMFPLLFQSAFNFIVTPFPAIYFF